ncbi:dimethylamine monooxygenase subunit DmmA family protein [Phytopseudomonas dryadis]|uniref:Dimethylamine monooxygenase subunit DmmA-like C-terminal domain-containing protein n=1 Tax=Phytopseudomonas dryadis TaxID=2487520 RepID=A0A4Q9QZM1_9GAMM|nr:dimethylamine monooxygenase subunit DmmA family protein [Pseudomonas dryadis]TBU89237.1 hypothetical protein DNK44_17190 [Pseudomonas dryadis]
MLSKPVYRSELAAPSGGPRILVMQATQRAGEALPSGALAPQDVLLCLGDGLEPAVAHQAFAELPELERHLRSLLDQACAGTRLCVLGDETFLWRIQALGRRAGLLGEEIELVRLGQGRTLYCVHCGTRQAIDSRDEVACRSCHVQLFVREHFSQRLGAYMGVCVDPDAPHGEARP